MTILNVLIKSESGKVGLSIGIRIQGSGGIECIRHPDIFSFLTWSGHCDRADLSVCVTGGVCVAAGQHRPLLHDAVLVEATTFIDRQTCSKHVCSVPRAPAKTGNRKLNYWKK